MNYIILASIAAFFYAIGELVYKYKISGMKININKILSFAWIYGGLFGLILLIYEHKYGGNDINIPLKFHYYIIIFSLFIFIGNIIYWHSCSMTTNPSLSRSIFTSISLIVLIIISIIYFKSIITVSQLIGIIIIFIGVLLICEFNINSIYNV